MRVARLLPLAEVQFRPSTSMCTSSTQRVIRHPAREYELNMYMSHDRTLRFRNLAYDIISTVEVVLPLYSLTFKVHDSKQVCNIF